MRRPSIAGKNHPNWKGTEASYSAIHLYLSYNYIKPSACEVCGTQQFKRLEWANLTGIYTRDRESYKALCPPCHRRLDAKTHCIQGHEFTPENTATRSKKGEAYRACRTCERIHNKNYHRKNLERRRAYMRTRYHQKKPVGNSASPEVDRHIDKSSTVE